MAILAPGEQPFAEARAAAQPVRALGVRWRVLLLLFTATVINYVDRANISVAAHGISKEFGLGPVQMGLLFSAFAWTYAVFNLPAGYLVDRLGSRIALGGAMLVWSAATCLQCFGASFGSLFGLRLIVGASETCAPLSCNRIVASWFPKSERGFATGGFVAGQYLGPALVTPLLFWIAATFSWRDVFSVSGLAGIVFALVFLCMYRDPMQSRTVTEAERLHIESGGAVARISSSGTLRWRDVRALLGFRQIHALCLGKFAVMSTQYFFLTWFPTYLVKARGMSLTHAGMTTSLPYLAASVGVVLSGWWSDQLFRRGATLSQARKIPIVTGFLLVSTMVLANFTRSNLLAVSIITFAYFAQGMSSTSWAIVADVAPERMIGTTSGIINFAGNLSGIVTPLIVGIIIAQTGSFAWALGFVGLCALVGAVAYTLVLGPVDRLQLPDPASATA